MWFVKIPGKEPIRVFKSEIEKYRELKRNMSDQQFVEENWNEQNDINVVFEELAFVEVHATNQGLVEGFKVGTWEGEREGYRAGYEIGFEVGKELALIYGTVLALEQTISSAEKPMVQKLIKQLRQSIENFPQYNDLLFDIKGNLENIQFKYKHLCKLINPLIYGVNNDNGMPEDDKKHQDREQSLSF